MKKKISAVLAVIIALNSVSLMARPINVRAYGEAKSITNSNNFRLIDGKNELKNIQEVVIFEEENGILKHTALVDNNNLSGYLAQIVMKDLPTTYAKILSINPNTGLVKLDLEGYVTIDDTGNQLDGAYVMPNLTKQGLDIFLEQVKTNLSGSYTLVSDLDASMFNVTSSTTNGQTNGDAALMETFTGVLNGNGHKIINLKVPLFLQTTNARIENLVIEDANIVSGTNQNTGRLRNGTLAMTMTNSTVRNVHVKGLYMKSTTWSGNFRAGGLVGYASNSNFYESSVTNFNIDTFWNRVGGIVGEMEGGLIENCYTQGKIGNIDRNNNVTFIGGIAGSTNNAVMNSNIANVNITSNSSYTNPVGGFVGIANGTTRGTNNLSMGDVIKSGYKFVQTSNVSKYTNSYEIASAIGQTSQSPSHIESIEKGQLKTIEFYDRLKLNPDIWNIEFMVISGIPTLKGNYPYDTSSSSSVDGANIPNYFRLKKHPDFESTKEILYSNLFLLNPFLKSEHYLEIGKGLEDNHPLNQHNIKDIFPLSKNIHKVDITNNNYRSIDGVSIILSDNTKIISSLSQPALKDSIATYMSDDLQVPYTYNKYVINTAGSTVQEINNTIANVTYDAELLGLVGGRHINDKAFTIDRNQNYVASDVNMLDDTAAAVIGEKDVFINKLLSSSLNFNTNLSDPVLNLIVKEQFTKNIINEYLYTYIYFKNWYNIQIEEMYLADLIVFNSEYYDSKFDISKVKSAVIDATRGQRSSSETHTFYSQRLAGQIGMNTIGDFIDHNIKVFAQTTNYSEWFKSYSKGVVIERQVDNLPSIDGSAYANLKEVSGGKLLLLALTYNTDDLFLFSIPTQLAYGSIMSYSDYYKVNGRQIMIDRLNKMADEFQMFYEVSSRIIDNPEEKLKNIKQFQIDSFKEVNTEDRWIVPPLSTIPAKKTFSQAAKIGITANGSGAYANGSSVFWVSYQFISTFSTATHETTHNQDGTYLLNGMGRRREAGAEDFAKGMFEQGHSGNTSSINFAIQRPFQSDHTGVLDPMDIASPEKIKDYYQKFYEALYTIDLLEAEALLELDQDIQRKMLYQHSFGENKTRSIWNPISSLDDYKALNITSYKDFGKNRLNITKTLNAGSQLEGKNSYGIANYASTSFYNPYNEDGRTDYHTFKRFGHELLAKSGYKQGFVGWTGYRRADGTIINDDIEAIRYATGDDTMTFERFDLEKYEEVETKINNSPYFEKDKYVEMFKTAFEHDNKTGNYNNKTRAQALRTTLIRSFSRQTDDFKQSIYQEKVATQISTAEEFVQKIEQNPVGNYTLTNDLDFSNVQTAGDSYITKMFIGLLDGNGFQIKNLQKPLLNTAKYSKIENIIFDNANLQDTSKSEVGILAKTLNNSSVENVHVTNSSVKGYDFVGGLVGKDTSGIYSVISVEATIDARKDCSGGIIAESTDTNIKDAYTTGFMTAVGDRSGGIIGGTKNTNITNTYGNMVFKGTGNTSSGGVVGYNHKNGIIKNSLSVGDGQGRARKFDGHSLDVNMTPDYKNNYEYQNATGTSVVGRLGTNHLDKVAIATQSDISSRDFYVNTLKFDPNIWNFDGLANGELPKFNGVTYETNSFLNNTNYVFYRVNEYTENQQGQYEQTGTIIKRGLANTTVNAPIKNYDIFVENTTHSDRFVQSNLNANNDTLLLKVYYDLKTYDINFDSNGGSDVLKEGIKHGKFLTAPAEPVKDDYLFGGWYTDVDFNNPFLFDTTPITQNIQLFAKWTSTAKSDYTIKYYTMNLDTSTYTEMKADQEIIKNAVIGEEVIITPDANKYDGFNLLDSNVLNKVILANGETVFDINYVRIQYPVDSTIDANNGVGNGTINMPEKGYLYGDTVIFTITPDAGYEVDTVKAYKTSARSQQKLVEEIILETSEKTEVYTVKDDTIIEPETLTLENEFIFDTIENTEAYKVKADTIMEPERLTSEEEIPLENNQDNSYQFTMPSGKVKIKVTFKKLGENPGPVEPSLPELLNLTLMQSEGRKLVRQDGTNLNNFVGNIANYAIYLRSVDTKEITLTARAENKTDTLTINGTSIKRQTTPGKETSFEPHTIAGLTENQEIKIRITRAGLTSEYIIKVNMKQTAEQDAHIYGVLVPEINSNISTFDIYGANADVIAATFKINLKQFGTDVASAFEGFANKSGTVFTGGNTNLGNMLDNYIYLNPAFIITDMRSNGQWIDITVEPKSINDMFVSISGSPVKIMTVNLRNNKAYTGKVTEMIDTMEVVADDTFASTMYYGEILDTAGTDASSEKETFAYLDYTALPDYINMIINHDSSHTRATFELYNAITNTLINPNNTEIIDKEIVYEIFAGTYYIKIVAQGYQVMQTENFIYDGTPTIDGIVFRVISLIEGDLTGNSSIDALDRAKLILALNQHITIEGSGFVTVDGEDIYADYNNDNVINALDLGRLIRNVGRDYEEVRPK